MHILLRSLGIGLVLVFTVGSTVLAADDVVMDPDGLTPFVEDSSGPAADLGDVCLNESTSGQVLLKAKNGSGASVWADGATVTITGAGATGADGADVTVGTGADSTISLELNWNGLAANTLSADSAIGTFSVTSTVIGAHSALAKWEADGDKSGSGSLARQTPGLHMSWNVIECNPTPVETVLQVSNLNVTDGNSATLIATLSSSGTGVDGKLVSFSLGGNWAGSAMTDADGQATLTGVAFSGYSPGTYPGEIGASFDGDASFGGSTDTADLDVTAAPAPVAPTIVINSAIDQHVYTLGQTVSADFSCSSDTAIVKCDGPVPSGANVDTSSVGWKTFVVEAEDADGDTSSHSVSYRVVYPFSYIAPVSENANHELLAGKKLKAYFTMFGNYGPQVLHGWPRHQAVNCDTLEPLGKMSTARIRRVKYLSLQDHYQFIWATRSEWAGSCRLIVVRLEDQMHHVASFTFVATFAALPQSSAAGG